MLFRPTGFYVFKIKYTLISIAIILLAVLLLTYIYLTALIETRTIDAMTWAIETKVIAIDPGHGGYDPGAKGPLGTDEKVITLQIAERVAKKLSMEGALVVLLRDEDEDFATPGPGTKKKRDLDNRIKEVEQKNASIVVSIHVNSFGSEWSGAQTFYNAKSEANENLARYIQEELKAATHTKRDVLPMNSSYLLEHLNPPACIVEVGFLSNPQEEKKLIDPTYQDKIAQAIYRGILKFMASQ